MGSDRILSMLDEGEPRRGMRRRRVMMAAHLSTSSGSHEVRIRDVSATGARIEGADLPALDTIVMLKRGSFSVYGRLVWRNGELGGVAFDEPLDEAGMMEALKGLPTTPTVQEPYRRPGLNRGSHPRWSDGRGWMDMPSPRS